MGLCNETVCVGIPQWFHIGANIRSVLISKVAIFLKRLGHDLLESGGDGARVAGEAFRVRMAVKTTESTQCFPGRPPRLLESSPLF